MIFDPLLVKFLPKKLLIWANNNPIFVVNCSGAKNDVIKKFCCTKKLPTRGQKNQKMCFFKNYTRKMEKPNFGISGTIMPKILFFFKSVGQGGG